MPDEVIWSDEEWDRKYEEEQAHIQALSDSLRPCPRHGVKARIERDDGVILGDCGCWYDIGVFDSLDEAVADWNEQPEIDRLQQRSADLQETLKFAAEYKGVEARPCPLCKYEHGLFVKRCQMHKDMHALEVRLSQYEAMPTVNDDTLVEMSPGTRGAISQILGVLDSVAPDKQIEFVFDRLISTYLRTINATCGRNDELKANVAELEQRNANQVAIIEELEAQEAEAGGWEPCEDDIVADLFEIYSDRNEIVIYYGDDGSESRQLPPDIRLCRKVRPLEATEGVQNE